MQPASPADKWDGTLLVLSDANGSPNVVQHRWQFRGQHISRSGQQMATGCPPAPPVLQEFSASKLQTYYNAFPACAIPMALCILCSLGSEMTQVICIAIESIAEDVCHVSAAACQIGKSSLGLQEQRTLTMCLTFCYTEAFLLQLLGRLLAVISCLVSHVECQQSASRVL